MIENYSAEKESIEEHETLEGWVKARCDEWSNHYDSNYRGFHEECWRIFRGQWNVNDKTRKSERSRIISPASQQAVESATAEVEEASFGRGEWFRMDDDDEEPQDIAKMEKLLSDEFKATKARSSMSDCLLTSAVTGTGIMELVVEERSEEVVSHQTDASTGLVTIGTTKQKTVQCKGVPVPTHNFVIDPSATSIDDGLGCAIQRYVSTHHVEQLIESGVYQKVELDTTVTDIDAKADPSIMVTDNSGSTKLTKYYGLVPRHLLEKADEDLDIADLVVNEEGEEESESYYIEACVVLANEGDLLKAEPNPFMKQDRPVIAFGWDRVPGVFWGRGIIEKAYNSQKALDAELRARIDALGLTVHPMLGLDATKVPRGTKITVSPGKQILTNGPPDEALKPFNFGSVDQITFGQAAELQKMVQTSTGAVDSAGVAGQMNGEGTAAGISMSLGAIVKRHKRTLLNFQENFVVPFVEKTAFRYMQYNPELFPVGDYSFKVTSQLSTVSREYEVGQMTQLLQTMGPESPVYNTLTRAIVDNMNLSNRDEILAAIDQANQPNPEAEKRAAEAHQAQIDYQKAQTYAVNAQGGEFEARTKKYQAETGVIPADSVTKRLDVVADMKTQDEKDFDRRVTVAELWREEQRARQSKSGGATVST